MNAQMLAMYQGIGMKLVSETTENLPENIVRTTYVLEQAYIPAPGQQAIRQITVIEDNGPNATTNGYEDQPFLNPQGIEVDANGQPIG